MKAMVLTDICEIDVREIADPKITKPNEVLLKVKKVGICGQLLFLFC